MHNQPHTEDTKLRMSKSHVGIPNFSRRRPIVVMDGVLLYHCSTCQEFKPFEDFYKNKRTILGITSECKKCHCKTAMESRDKERSRENNKQYMRRAVNKNPDKFRVIWKNRKRAKDEKSYARSALNGAVRSGKIVKPFYCEDCGRAIKLTAHHNNYDEPLKVEWLCYECHAKRHRKFA